MEGEIYFKQEEIKLGCGSTAKSTVVDNYYQVVEVGEDHVEIHLLDFSDRPVGKGSILHKDKLKEYIPCPDYFYNKKKPGELLIERHIQSGDQHFEKREFFSAEYEYDRALSMNQNHLKANLGKGRTLFARGEKEAAKKVFSRLSQLDTLYDKENKHIFNEFGIELRKKKMFQEAISNYLKAVSIDPKDEILYYNLGRACYEEGKREEAVDHLNHALTIKPDFHEAEEFLSKIRPS
ncbi:MAG: tetratricopeptide repeat protein [Thermodesulfobacteriota bacterium]|nr:tetratricopeptide repeat protein [Thermodesulfobacteriota bacterium]